MRRWHLSNFRKEPQKNAAYVEIYTLQWKKDCETILFSVLELVNMKAHLAEICGSSHSAIKDTAQLAAIMLQILIRMAYISSLRVWMAPCCLF